MDAGQDDLRVAGSDQAPHLFENRRHRHRTAAAAGVGDDAVTAEGVAAVLDLDEGAAALGEAVNPGDDRRLHAADVGDPHPFCAPFEEFDQAAFFLVAEHQRNARQGLQGGRVDLGVAAGDDHPAALVEAPGPAHQVARLAVGGGGDGAGVDQHQVGAGFEGDDAVAGLFQALLQGRRLELVGLATEGGNGDGTLHAIQPPPRTASPR